MTTSTRHNYGVIVGGYRVVITNWKNGDNEMFFRDYEDAREYLDQHKAYNYKGTIETIHLHVRGDN
jgi:hypothetical protein